MSRKLTVRNYNHPHYRLKAFEESVYKSHQCLSAVQLNAICDKEEFDPALSRKQKIEKLVAVYVMRWKEQWKKERGWDFEDIYDAGKFQQHIKTEAERAAREKAQLEEISKQAIDHRPLGLDGEPITKETFDKMPEEMQKTIRDELSIRINKIIASGFAGVKPNGNIVDRRAYPDALPIQKNEKLGTPEPLPLVAAIAA